MSIRKERPLMTPSSSWEKELNCLLDKFHKGKIDRRRFIASAMGLLGLAATPRTLYADYNHTSGSRVNGEGSADFPEDPWLTIAAAQRHLFPNGGAGPGSDDINATRYLQGVLSEHGMDQDDKVFILDGVDWLNDIAHKQEQAIFADLEEVQRESVLRQIEKTRAGERWIALVLLYLFEALLCDPVYGGNPDGIGWKWLKHQPGFPRPPEEKTYQKL